LQQLPDSVKQTIWKYFNRSKYRATPFGSFAGIAQVPVQLQHSEKKEPLEIGHQHLKAFINWSITAGMAKKRIYLKPGEKLFSNSSYYKHCDAIRYLCLAEGEFNLSEIPYNEVIEAVLLLCNKPKACSDVFLELKEKHPKLDDAPKLVRELLRCQLLYKSSQPNIIGEDYFQRIGFRKKANVQPYLIAERQINSGSFDANLVRKLPALIGRLTSMQQIHEQKMLQDFRNKFQRRYESAAIPLMLALDPELGIGYGDFARDANASDILDFMQDNTQTGNSKDLLRKHFQEALSDHLLYGKTIDLKDILAITNDSPLPLPNTFSLLGYQYEDKLVIEKLGGISANMLLGRFTLASDEVWNTCRDIARIEQEANPDVIFFDVAYMGEPTVDNVNRRRAIYPYQLSILNYDTSDAPLELNELYLHVSGNEIILRSLRLNCRVVPRIASAYNHGRSDLSVFRFLSDLQYQNVQGSLHVDLETILPDRKFYPRVTYENFVLSSAKWKLENKGISKPGEINSYLDSLQIPRYFRTGLGDQTLTFDRHDSEDMGMFQSMLAAHKNITIEETFINEKSLVSDLHGDLFAHQLILCITHGETIYTDKRPRATSGQEVTAYPPGSDWLYFEIFTHPAGVDELLSDVLIPLLRKWRQQISCLFFVRYEEHGEHIRLRIKVKDNTDAFALVRDLSERLSDPIDSGKVSSFRLNTYYPEVHRYGAAQMQAVEQHFAKDSDYVLSLLGLHLPVPTKYTLCAMLLEKLEINIGFSEKALLALLNKISASFNQEHGLTARHYKRMNIEYNNFRHTIRPYLNTGQRKKLNIFAQSFSQTLTLYPEDMRPAIFADLMHMHINRLFPERQRSHEMMIYYFLYKDALGRIRRKTTEALGTGHQLQPLTVTGDAV
jgi:thiopeptide-type bacteriocin biosynthesis protein